MKVETKYSIGDTVWYEEYDNDSDTFIPEELKIKYIQVVNWKENSFDITYFGQIVVNDDSNIDILYFDCPFWEGLLYASKEECQEVCDKKNKKGSD